MKEGLFEKNMSLSEMDAVLEHFLTEESSTIRILVDIPLTEEEYIQLSDKLIGKISGKYVFSPNSSNVLLQSRKNCLVKYCGISSRPLIISQYSLLSPLP